MKYRKWTMEWKDFSQTTLWHITEGHGSPEQYEKVEVVELEALTDCQKKLDEAKDYIERFIYSYHNPHEMDFDAVALNAEKFLKGLGEG